MHNNTAEDICDELQKCVAHESNPTGLFRHPITKQWHHMAFTGFKKSDLGTFISSMYNVPDNREWFWSCSPKLWSTAGEKAKKAIKPEVVGSYAEFSDHGQLKYVVNGTQQSWDEVEEHTQAFRDAGVNWDVFIMPVGATKEQQEDEQIAEIAMEAMKRGYHMSGRLHCYVFGNKIGT
jgi:hypothetical protein